MEMASRRLPLGFSSHSVSAAHVYPAVVIMTQEITCWELVEALLENRALLKLCGTWISPTPALSIQGLKAGT